LENDKVSSQRWRRRWVGEISRGRSKRHYVTRTTFHLVLLFGEIIGHGFESQTRTDAGECIVVWLMH
jgi:hypothetical protein